MTCHVGGSGSAERPGLFSANRPPPCPSTHIQKESLPLPLPTTVLPKVTADPNATIGALCLWWETLGKRNQPPHALGGCHFSPSVIFARSPTRLHGACAHLVPFAFRSVNIQSTQASTDGIGVTSDLVLLHATLWGTFLPMSFGESVYSFGWR